MEKRTVPFESFGHNGFSSASSSAAIYEKGQHHSGISTRTSETSFLSSREEIDRQRKAISLEEKSSSSFSAGSSAHSTTSPRRVRRITCTARTTEELNSSPFGYMDDPVSQHDVGIPDGPSMEDRSFSNRTAIFENRPLSLHGLSLASRHEEEARMPDLSEIQSRPYESASPVASTNSSVTFKSMTPEAYGPAENKTLTKSAKKRMKKKIRQQKQQSDIPGTVYFNSVQSEKTPWSPLSTCSQNGVFSKADLLSELLSDRLPKESIRFQEQGIQNLGDTCFLGSAMQFLLASSPFCWLMTLMGRVQHYIDQASHPTICAMGSLANALKIQSVEASKQNRHQVKRTGRIYQRVCLKVPSTVEKSNLHAIVPSMLSFLVSTFRSRFEANRSNTGQDVQEFLLFVLDNIDKEILQLRNMFGKQNTLEVRLNEFENTENDSWMTVGKKNKVSVQRTTGERETSILSAIFKGCVQSEVKAAKMVASVTAHPFVTLILDILPDQVHSIEDALKLYTARDSIPDYRVPGEQRRVMANKSNIFKKLPPYLIVCVKQYVYTSTGLQKIVKRIEFGPKLQFQRSWMAESRNHCVYRLCATCNHHGQGHGGDHYTANVLQRDGCWIHFNDSTFSRTNLEAVLYETPYLLMYEQI